MQARFELEGSFHKSLSGCANIVRLEHFTQNSKAYYYIMEYCETDLSKMLKSKGTLPEEEAMKLFSDMLAGYKSIRDKKANHRDLKVSLP